MSTVDPGTLKAALGIIGLRLDYTDQATPITPAVQSISLVDAILTENSISSNRGKSLIRAYWLGAPDIPEPTISLREFIDAFLKAIIAVFQARGYQNIAEELRRQHNLDRILGDITKRIGKFESDSIIQQDAIRRFLKIMPGSTGNINDISDVDASMFDSTEANLSYAAMFNAVAGGLPYGGGSVSGFLGEFYKRLVLDSLKQVEDPTANTSSDNGISLIDNVKVLIKNQTNTASASDADTLIELAKPQNTVLKAVWDALEATSWTWTRVIDALTSTSSTWSSALALGTQEGSLDLTAASTGLSESQKNSLFVNVQGYVQHATDILNQVALDPSTTSSSTYEDLADQIGQDFTALSSFFTGSTSLSAFADAATLPIEVWSPGLDITRGSYYFNEADGLFYQAQNSILRHNIGTANEWASFRGYLQGNVVRYNGAWYQAQHDISSGSSASKVPGTDTTNWTQVRAYDSEYLSTTIYKVGDYVAYNGQLFEALKQSLGSPPPSDDTPSDRWKALTFADTNVFTLNTSYVFQRGLLTKAVQQASDRLSDVYDGFQGEWSPEEIYVSSEGDYFEYQDNFYTLDGTNITQPGMHLDEFPDGSVIVLPSATDFEAYVNAYPDLLSYYNDNISPSLTKAQWGENHWLEYGRTEGRPIGGTRYIVTPKQHLSDSVYDPSQALNYSPSEVVAVNSSPFYWQRTSTSIDTLPAFDFQQNYASGELVRTDNGVYKVTGNISWNGVQDDPHPAIEAQPGEVFQHAGQYYITKQYALYYADAMNTSEQLDSFFNDTSAFSVYTGPESLSTFFASTTPIDLYNAAEGTYWTPVSQDVSLTPSYEAIAALDYATDFIVLNNSQFWKRTSASLSSIPTFSSIESYNASSGALLQSDKGVYALKEGEAISYQGTKDVPSEVFTLDKGDVVTHAGVQYVAIQDELYFGGGSSEALDDFFVFPGGRFEVYTDTPSSTFFELLSPDNEAMAPYWTLSSLDEWVESLGEKLQVYDSPLTDFFTVDTAKAALVTRYKNDLQSLTQRYKTFLQAPVSSTDSLVESLTAAVEQIAGHIDSINTNFSKLSNGVTDATTDANLALAIKNFIDLGLSSNKGLLLTDPSQTFSSPTLDNLSTNKALLQTWYDAVAHGDEGSVDPRQIAGNNMREVISDVLSMVDSNGHIAITEEKKLALQDSMATFVDSVTDGFQGVGVTLMNLTDRIDAMISGTTINFAGTYQSAAFFKLDQLREAFEDFSTPLNWDVATIYPAGKVIKRGSVYYKSLVGSNVGYDPSVTGNTDKWQAINLNVHVAEQALAMRTLALELEGSLNYRFDSVGSRLVTVLTAQEGVTLQEAMLNVFQLEDQGGVSSATPNKLRVRAFDAATNPGSAELYYLYTLRQVAYYDDPGRDPTYWKGRRDAAIERSAPAAVGTSGSTGLLAQIKTKYTELADSLNMASESSRTVCDTNSNRLTYLNSGQMSAMMADFDTIRNDMIGLLNEINNTLTRADFTSSSRYTSALKVSESEMTAITGAGYSISGVGTTWSTDITSDTSLFANNTAGNTTVKFFAPIADATTAILKQLSGLQNFFHNTSSTVNVGMYGQAIQGSLYQFASWGSLSGRFQDVFYDLYNDWGDFGNHFAGYRVRRTGASNGNIHVSGWSDGTWGSVDATRYFGDKLDDAYDFAKSHFNALNTDLNSWTTKYSDFHLAVVTQAELWVSRAYATTSPGEDVMFRSVESGDISPEERRLMAKILNLLMSMLVAMLSSNVQVRASVFRLIKGEVTLDQLGDSLRLSQRLANNLIQRAIAMAADLIEREKSNKAASADFVASNPVSTQSLYDLASFWQANQTTEKEVKDVARQQRRYS